MLLLKVNLEISAIFIFYLILYFTLCITMYVLKLSLPGFNYTTHRILLGKNIYGIENLANPGMLPASGARITILPLRLSHGSGAAARIVGVFHEMDSSSGKITPFALLLCCVQFLYFMFN